MCGASVWAGRWGRPGSGCDKQMGQRSLESSLHPPQRVLDPPRLSLAGLLKVGIVVSGQEVDVGGGEPGDAVPKVGLRLAVWAVGVHSLLEGMHLTHSLCYPPRNREWIDEQRGGNT